MTSSSFPRMKQPTIIEFSLFIHQLTRSRKIRHVRQSQRCGCCRSPECPGSRARCHQIWCIPVSHQGELTIKSITTCLTPMRKNLAGNNLLRNSQRPMGSLHLSCRANHHSRAGRDDCHVLLHLRATNGNHGLHQWSLSGYFRSIASTH